MSLNDQILAAMVVYGLPLLFGVVMLASTGVPLPASLLLIAAGSFVEQGELDFWWVISITAAAAVLGDHIGYGLGRWGGRRLLARLTGWIGGEAQLRKAEVAMARWGGPGIFLSRWLLSPVGPAVNITSGMMAYSLPAFFLFDIAGELIWVAIYVAAGRIFSDRVQVISELLGSLVWVIVGIVVAALLAQLLFQRYRRQRSHTSRSVDTTPTGSLPTMEGDDAPSQPSGVSYTTCRASSASE